jgi:hypothetical protein
VMFRLPRLPYPLKYIKKAEIFNPRERFTYPSANYCLPFYLFNLLDGTINIPDNKIFTIINSLIYHDTTFYVIAQVFIL